MWGWMKSEVKKKRRRKKVDIRDELMSRILDAADRIKKREDQLRRKTRDLHILVTEFIESDGGIFEHLL